MIGPTGEKRDNTMAKLLPYLIISGTDKEDMPDMSLIAETIIDPEGKSAGGFFTDMGTGAKTKNKILKIVFIQKKFENFKFFVIIIFFAACTK